MYIQAQTKMVYLAHPKTASQATAKALETVGFQDCFPHEGHHSELHEQRLLKRYGWPPREEWIVFTTVRNHWDWCISLLFARQKRVGRELVPLDWNLELFKDGLKPCFYIEESRLFGLHAPKSDVIVRFEDLEPGVNATLAMRKISPVKIEHFRPTIGRAGRDYHEFYTPETRDYVYHRFQEEIYQYGYEY